MKSGIIRSLLLYVIGFSVSAFVYYSSGRPYAHGPNLHFLIFLLTFLIGVIWLIAATIRYFIKPGKVTLGYILINGIATLAFVIYAWLQ